MDIANDNENSPKSNGYNLRNKNKNDKDSSDSTSDEDYNPETDNCKLDNNDYKKFLYELFPSKYLKNQINNKSNNKKNKSNRKNNKSINNKKNKSNNNKKNKSNNKNNKSNNKNNKSNNKNNKSNNKKNNKVKTIKKKAFNALKNKDENEYDDEFPSNEDDLLDEQDNIDMNKSNFSIVYTFGDNEKIINQKILQTFGEQNQIIEDGEDCEDDGDDSEDNKISQDSDIDFDDDEYQENLNKNVNDLSENDWEKMFLLEFQ